MSAILRTLSNPFIALGGALIIALVSVGIAWQMSSTPIAGQYATASIAPITAVGGANSDLSFQVSGQIVSVPVRIGEMVTKGTPLVVLDRAQLSAQRAGAAASLEAAQAKLAIAQSGTRPEQLAVNQTAVTQGQAALLDAVRSAYINADDAIHNKADQFLTNPRSSSAAFTFTVPDEMLQSSVLAERVALEDMLVTWQAQVDSATFTTSDPLSDAGIAQANLSRVSAFLDDVSKVLVKTPASAVVPLTTLQGYEASINAARLNVSGSKTSVTSATTALQSAQGAFTLAKAGATTNDIAVAEAAVHAAQATLAGIDVALAQTTLVAPFAGTVTTLNAHVGQTATPGQVIVSLQSTGGTSDHALVVPTSSIIQDNGQSFVYLKSATTPVKTAITTGLTSSDGMTEIVSGINAGDQVLSFGTTK